MINTAELEGRVEGKMKKAKEIVAKLKVRNVPLKEIEEIAGLSVEEIARL